MKITDKVLQLLDSELTLEHYYLLYAKYYANGMLVHYRPKDDVYYDLMALELLTKNKSISKKGRKFLEEFWDKASITNHKSGLNDKFEEFWKAFPRTDAHSTFVATRRDIRSSKTKAKNEFVRTVQEKGVSADNLIQAIKKDVDWRKSQSKFGENKLTYIKNPASWLKDELYVSFLEEGSDESSLNNKHTYGKGLS